MRPGVFPAADCLRFSFCICIKHVETICAFTCTLHQETDLGR